jgi:hypothetical protein
MHSLVWFWTVGLHDPSWVQAFAAIALVFLTAATLVILYFYARDTRTIAKTGIDQIRIAEEERSRERSWKIQAAVDCVHGSRDCLVAMKNSLKEDKDRFGERPPQPLYREDWPEITSVLYQIDPRMRIPILEFGGSLKKVDQAVVRFLAAHFTDEEAPKELVSAIEDSIKKHNVAVLQLKSLVSKSSI